MPLGLNDSGDFDQLSLAGVDFGEDYCQDYNVKPINLEGDYMYHQLGHIQYDQLGTIPTGLGSDYQQMGTIPSGLGYSSQQLGTIPSGLGFNPMQMWQGLSQQQKMIYGVAGALALVFILRQMEVIKRPLPLIG